jgi:hypothetical protein
MDKIVFALTIVGVEKTELAICNIFLDLLKNERWGEIPGKNLRQLFDLTKDKLFNILENLLSKNIFKHSRNSIPINTVYITGGDAHYIFNPEYLNWIPSDVSLFYKLCKLYSYRFNNDSWKMILNHYDIREEIEKKTSLEEKLTPYQLYDLFCAKYRKLFNREYEPSHIERDLAYCKKVICDCSFKNLRDAQILEFLEWTFRVKTRSFKGEFLVGFLPLCLRDYLASTSISIVNPGYIKDENGNIIKNET